MNEEILGMLDEEIKARIGDLASLNSGSDEQTKAIDGIAKLYKLRIEDSKAVMEYNKEIDDDNFRRDQMEQEQKQHQEQVEREEQSRKEQLAEQRIDRYVRISIAAAELAIPLAFYAVWMRRGFKFEETGTFTSTTFRGLFSRFRPTKK